MLSQSTSHQPNSLSQWLPQTARKAWEKIFGRRGEPVAPLAESLKQTHRQFMVEAAYQVESVPFVEPKKVIISDKLVGLSLTSPIYLTKCHKLVSFQDALVNHVGESCRCPLSNKNAIINAGFIYSFTLKQLILPVLLPLHDQGLVDECKAISSLEKRLKWVAKHKTQAHLYAFVSTIAYRLGADLPSHRLFNPWLQKKIGLTAEPDILQFIECVQTSRLNQAKRLTELKPQDFGHHLELRQLVQPDGTAQLDWQPAIDAAKTQRYKLIAVKAQHGQGKTQAFIKALFQEANQHHDGGVVIAHRQKLLAQISQQLGCFYYQDYSPEVSFSSLARLKGMAICLHSLAHNHFLRYVAEAHAVFIDEASQVLKTLYTDKHVKPEVENRLIEAVKNTACIYLTDADLTTEDIQHYQQLFKLKKEDILVITAEPPPRDYHVTLTCSASPTHYRTRVIEAIEQDLIHHRPVVLAVESQTQGKSALAWFKKRFPEKKIVLLSSDMANNKAEHFIKHLTKETATLDLLIHTSIIGTGVSIEHPDQRFKKGYGLFSGNVLYATECLQMMRRFRDITQWEIGLLSRPHHAFMTSFYRNLGAQALAKHEIETSSILSAIQLNDGRQKALFVPGFKHLLTNEYGFHVTEEIAADKPIEKMLTSALIRAEEKQKLLQAFPLPLERALLLRKKGYHDEAERYQAESAICRDYFKCKELTEMEAELWCNPTAREAIHRQEEILKILKLDPTVSQVKQKNAILTEAGITMALFRNQQLSQDAIRTLRDQIASQCAALVGLGLLKERYVKAEKIPNKMPIKFIKDLLASWGFSVQTVQTGNEHKERRLNISISAPIARLFNLDVRTEKDVLRDKALALRAKGLGYGAIAKELGLKTRFQARHLVAT